MTKTKEETHRELEMRDRASESEEGNIRKCLSHFALPPVCEVRNMSRNAGFTLIELMIVIAIISIIVAIAVPGLIRSRVQTNESAAIENLRTVSEAEIGYNATKYRFADFDALVSETDGAGTAFLDNTWAERKERQGYLFTITSADDGDFVCYADPKAPGITGVRWFRVDASGLIRWNSAARPGETDPVIGTTE
jgi:type IV pilus assembly protein PilA